MDYTYEEKFDRHTTDGMYADPKKTFENLTEPARFGNYPLGNYTQIDPDGSIRHFGKATCWKDMVADLFGKKLNNNTGRVDYDWDNNALKFQNDGSLSTVADRVQGNLEINHEFKVGVGIVFKPHIHWFQQDVNLSDKYVIGMKYRLQRNNNLTTQDWTTLELVLNDGQEIWTPPALGSGEWFNQISSFPDITVDCGISDTLQFQMTRTDSFSQNILVYFMDVHGEIDSPGSRDVIVK